MTSDNLTKEERKGRNMFKDDLKDNVYQIEDTGSCIVWLEKKFYEDNVNNNLAYTTVYEEVNRDCDDSIDDEW